MRSLVVALLVLCAAGLAAADQRQKLQDNVDHIIIFMQENRPLDQYAVHVDLWHFGCPLFSHESAL